MSIEAGVETIEFRHGRTLNAMRWVLLGGLVLLLAACAPSSTGLPVVSVVGGGQPLVGATVSSTAGVWANVPTGYGYSWQRCSAASGGTCTAIAGAAASTYVLAAGDAGFWVRSVVTASNKDGAASAAATPVGPVAAATPPQIVTAPVVSGESNVGVVLSSTAGTWTGATSVALRWQRCDATGASCADIVDVSTGQTAAGATYTVAAADIGGRLRSVSTGTNTAGSTDAPSAPTAVVAAPWVAPLEVGERRAAVALDGDGRLTVFWTGPEGVVHDRWQSTPGAGPWSPFGTLAGQQVLGNPTAAANSNGDVWVFAVGVDHKLRYSTGRQGTWTPWSVVLDGGNWAGSPAVGVNSDGRLEVFTLGAADAHVHHSSQAAAGSTTWGAFADLGGPVVGNLGVGRVCIAVGFPCPAGLHLFAVGAGGSMLHNEQATGGTWGGWSTVTPGTGWTSSAAVLSVQGVTTIWARANGTPNDYWYTQTQTSPTGGWNAPFPIGIPAGTTWAGGPGVALNADGRMEFLGIAQDGHLYDNYETSPASGTFSGYNDLGTINLAAPTQLTPVRTPWADPDLLTDASGYYLFGTDNQWGRVPMSHSTSTGWSAPTEALRTPAWWAVGNFWAPEVVHAGSTYYLYYAASVTSAAPAGGDNVEHAIGVACSTSPGGPYDDCGLTPNGYSAWVVRDPTHRGVIDPNVVYAAGSYYLLWSLDWGPGGPSPTTQRQILGCRLNPDMKECDATPTVLLAADWNSWEQGTVEAPSLVVGSDGKFHLFYSGGFYNSSYATGEAICGTTPLGACTRTGGGPILADGWGGLTNVGGADIFALSPGAYGVVLHAGPDFTSGDPRTTYFTTLTWP